ncbi:MAG: hypothetical protein GY772_02245 [bacterium]|nr:hypothetical protein [bacterium]MDP7572324.1 hypothetical protein [Myxococcota bacterium]
MGSDGFPVFGFGHAWRIRAEEVMLAASLGSEYEAYRGRIARLLPGLY